MKQRAKILIASFLLVVLCFSGFFVFAHAIPTDKLSQVSVGMSETQVKNIVGAPQGVRYESTGSTVFYYGGFQQLRWCSVEIHFVAGDRGAVSVFHDH